MPTIQPIVSTAKATADIWSTLTSTYAKPKRGHLQQIKLQIKGWTKGTKTIDEYLQGFVTRFDQLALLGKPIEHKDQVEYIFGGLPEEYKSISDQLEGRDITPTVTEIHEKLLNKEAKLLTSLKETVAILVTANVASTQTPTHRHNQNQCPPQHNQWNRNQQTKNFNNNNRYQKGSQGGYQGRCQLCGTQGHSARRCPQLGSHGSSSGSVSVNNAYPPWKPHANLALGSTHQNNSWLLDSGATHHMTSDLDNLALHTPYNDNDAVLIGDGSPLPIMHSGSLSFPSSSKPLSLNNVLCVPNIHKNLISVYRLCNANKVSVEYFPAHFQVKDLSSGAHCSTAEPRMSYTSGQSHPLPFNPFSHPLNLHLLSKTGMIVWATSLYLL